MSRKNNQDEEREERIKQLMDRARKYHDGSETEKKQEKSDKPAAPKRKPKKR